MKSPSTEKEIVVITTAIAKYLPVPLILISIVSFYTGDLVRGYISLGAIPPSLLTLAFLKRGPSKYSVIYLTLLITILDTMVCITGMGIHDIAIIVFPVVILFSSLALDDKSLVIVFVFVSIAIFIITMGEYWNWYNAKPPQSGRISDSLIVSIVILVTVSITYLFSHNILLSTARTESEVLQQQSIKSELEKHANAKQELLREVHHRVKNNLAFTSSLVDIETMVSGENSENLRKLQAKIIGIARANDPLFQNEKYGTVPLDIYLKELIEETYGLTNVKFNLNSCFIPVQYAVPVGVLLHQIILVACKHRERNVTVNLTSKNERSLLEVISDNMSLKQSLESMTFEKSLIEIMTDEIAGKYTIDKGIFQFYFQANQLA